MQSFEMQTKLNTIVRSLTFALLDRFGASGFSERTFYAEAFCAVLFSNDKRFKNNFELAQGVVREKWLESQDVRQHLEFLWYAQDFLGDELNPLKLPFEFSHTIRAKPTNWILLRALFNIRHSSRVKKILWKLFAKFIILANWRNGIVLDRGLGAMVRGEQKTEYTSQQYMAFMLVLMADLFEATGDVFFKQRFLSGLFALLKEWRDQNYQLTEGRGAYQL
ncbi:MAG: hypothetical protein V1855_04815, partial [bacterium]